MKVKDLIKKLQEQNQELEIILSSDEEGNSFYTVDKDILVHKVSNEEKAVVLYPLALSDINGLND
jgi:hypothetical protein